MMTTTTSTSIIMTTTMRSMSTITTMTTPAAATITTMSMNTIIMTTRTASATIPTAPAITIITMPTRCSPPGARRRPKIYTQADIDRILTALDSGDYGDILRAKGIVNGTDGAWIEFDYVPEEHEIRAGHPDYTGRLCVIGSNLKEDKLAELFGL
ncbi:MAG: GTP-binding protein [Dysosmobacter sp.]